MHDLLLAIKSETPQGSVIQTSPYRRVEINSV